ncbi:MAG TPA: YciI family protein [Candidatus Dormibacteraeota bacterium]|jgi:hypothetical protein|nr:YciI family protein [Candidatus Dormibacteraeota bacterium]
MEYAILIYERPGSYDGLSDQEARAISAEYYAIRRDARVVGGGHLSPVDTATTVRVEGGETMITDGPFADTKEVFGGYFLLQADDLDVAVELAGRIPAARMGGSVEIRSLVEPPV